MANRSSAVPVLLACALSISAPVAVVGQADPEVRDTVLENGLHVIVLPDRTVPVVTLEVVVRAGAFTQLTPEEEGLPHILEHMLFNAYGGRGWGSYAGDVGATYNGTTGDERVTYFVTLPSENAEKGMELLGNLFREPSFDGRALENELRVVRGELERRSSDPYWLLSRDHGMRLWGSAFQRKNAIGNLASIMGATATRIDEHYERYYVPNNAALIVSGDIEVEDAFDWAHDRFRRWKQGRDPFAAFPAPRVEPLGADQVGVVDADASDVTILVGWHGPSVGDDASGSYAADIFTEMLRMPTSGLQERLVDSGLFQSADIAYQTLSHVGPITLVVRTTPETLQRALEALGDEMALLAAGDFLDADDLVAAKRRIRVRRALNRESTPLAAHELADAWAVGGLDHYRGYEGALERVTLEDLSAFVERYLSGRPVAISGLGPAGSRASLESALSEAVTAWRNR